MALLAPLKDAVTARCVRAERGVSAGLGADCSLPVAAHASIGASGEISLRALIGSADGSQILRASVTGDDPDAVALDAVQQLYGLGAEKILAELRD